MHHFPSIIRTFLFPVVLVRFQPYWLAKLCYLSLCLKHVHLTSPPVWLSSAVTSDAYRCSILYMQHRSSHQSSSIDIATQSLHVVSHAFGSNLQQLPDLNASCTTVAVSHAA